MKRKKIIAALSVVLCCMGAVSVPGIAIASAAEQVQSYTAQENYIDSFKATVETYMNDNNISGTVYTEGFKASTKILVEVMSDSDAQLVKNFIETEGKGAFYIDFTPLGPGRGIRILAGEETLMNIKGNVSQFMEENNIIGYTYYKSSDTNIITVVCNSNEDIEHIKAYVAEKCYRAERLEYELPDFEVNPPEIAPTDLEDTRLILDDFIMQNGINGYTKIAPYQGKDKVWVILNPFGDKYHQKINLFMSLYGIDSDTVIIDGEATNAYETVIEHSDDKEEPIMHVAATISTFMEEHSIEGYIYQKQNSEVLVIVCKSNDDISQVKTFVTDKGYRTDRLEYTLPDFEVEAPETVPTDLKEIQQILNNFIKQNGINGYTEITTYKNKDMVLVILDPFGDEYTRKIEFFLSQYGIDKESVIITTMTYNSGDINNDSNINAADASTILAYYAMVSTNYDGGFNEGQKKAADVNNDGWINAVDASCILSYYAYVSTTKEQIMPLNEFINKPSEKTLSVESQGNMWASFLCTVEWNGITFNSNSEIDATAYTKDQYIGKASDFKGIYSERFGYEINPTDSLYTTKENAYVLIAVKTDGSIIAMTNPAFLDEVVYKPSTEDVPYEDVKVWN